MRSIVIPKISHSIYTTTSRRLLESGSSINVDDDDPVESWRRARQEETINALPDTSDNAKIYINRWNTYAMELNISSNCYLAEVLTRFAEANKDWFQARPRLVKEFVLHVLVLWLRGTVDVEVLIQCVEIVEGYTRLHVGQNIETHGRIEEKDGTTRFTRGISDCICRKHVLPFDSLICSAPVSIFFQIDSQKLTCA